MSLRGKWVWRDGKFIPYENGPKPLVHSVITDSIAPTRNMCDGKLYDSASAFRRTTRAHGCYEVGNDEQRDTRNWEVPGLEDELRKNVEKIYRS